MLRDKKLLKSANASRSYSKITLAQFFETRCTLSTAPVAQNTESTNASSYNGSDDNYHTRRRVAKQIKYARTNSKLSCCFYYIKSQWVPENTS